MGLNEVYVIGAGLAGSEAAYQLAKLGIKVKLYEMRPIKKSPAHHSDYFGELVCSNSLKNSSLENAAGLLKEEMRHLDSLIIKCADLTKVPAGAALAVDRDEFAKLITKEIKENPLIEVINEEVCSIPKDKIVIVASGPLTDGALAEEIKNITSSESLYFYDAAAPLITKDCIDFDIAYYKSRYDKGDKDYINCPFTKDEFFEFYYELIKAERAELKEFEKEKHFEACMPIESLASRGFKTLTFGPMKPVGLEKPNGERPFAVVQLRQDNATGSLYNIVGFQTNLKFKEQKRVFSMIPGLKNIDIYRYGVMHRNTFLCAPLLLNNTLNLKEHENIFFAGQICGVEGYIESAASGIIAAYNAVAKIKEKGMSVPPTNTVLGALLDYITTAAPKNFQPMNANYGIIKANTKDKLEIANESLKAIDLWKESVLNNLK